MDCQNTFHNTSEAKAVVEQYWHEDHQLQQLHDDFIENTISNYFYPWELLLTSILMENFTPYQWPLKKAQ